jgi:hypothetical protein
MATNDREAIATAPEDAFIELFAEVFGLEKVQLLAHEYPVEDIYHTGRSIDYALYRLLATASGKTVTAITEARRLAGRTLWHVF